MPCNIKMLKALNGDCILISYGENYESHILVDGGMGFECIKQLKRNIENIKREEQKLNLVILTHIDNDHISGMLKIFSMNDFDFGIIEKMWFNYGENLKKELGISSCNNIEKVFLSSEKSKISFAQARDLESVLLKNKVDNTTAMKNEVYEIFNAKIILVSPSLGILRKLNETSEKKKLKEVKISAINDYSKSVEYLNNKKFDENISLENKSSIAFIFEWSGKKILFLGDAAASEIVDTLSEMGYSSENPLEIACCKISHHASKHNTSNELIKMLKCKNYFISTNRTASGRPSKECLSRIICNSKDHINFLCNYNININNIFTNAEIEKYSIHFMLLDEKGIDLEELEV